MYSQGQAYTAGGMPFPPQAAQAGVQTDLSQGARRNDGMSYDYDANGLPIDPTTQPSPGGQQAYGTGGAQGSGNSYQPQM